MAEADAPIAPTPRPPLFKPSRKKMLKKIVGHAQYLEGMTEQMGKEIDGLQAMTCPWAPKSFQKEGKALCYEIPREILVAVRERELSKKEMEDLRTAIGTIAVGIAAAAKDEELPIDGLRDRCFQIAAWCAKRAIDAGKIPWWRRGLRRLGAL